MKNLAVSLRKIVSNYHTTFFGYSHDSNQAFGLTRSKSGSHHKTILLVFGLLTVFISIFIIQRVFLSQTNADTFNYPHGPVEEATVSLSAPEDVSIDLTPTPNGDNIGISSNSTTVSTNNVNGYSLTLNTNYDSTSDESNKLVHLSMDTHYIDALSTNNTELIASTWGYTTTDPTATPTTSLFSAVPTKNTPTTIKTTTASNVSSPDTTTVYYGAKVSFSKPAGNYQNTVVYTALPGLVNAPTITTISPNTGSTAGGDTITITGTNFDSIVNITIDGGECTNISITSATTATCTTPANTAGAKDVIVTNQGSSATKTNGFTYQNPAPQVTSISPNSGHFRGGETFTITGTGFTGATVVKLGTSNCRSFTVNSDTQITCLSTGYNLGTNASQAVSVNVTAPTGTNTANTLFTYRYPTTSFLGGQTYTHVLGTDIEFGSKITVGGQECTDLLIMSDTMAACKSPANTLGSKALSITAAPNKDGDMQGFSETCNAGTVGTIRVLKDTRDEQKYRVRCMEDNKWWMIDNLALGNTGNPITLDSSNTNLPSATTFTLPANAITTAAQRVTNGRCDSTVISASGTAGNMTCDGTTTVTGTDDNENYNFAAYADPSSTNNSLNDNCQPGAPGLSADSLSGCGYLYNWYTATAGTGVYDTPADTTTNANAATGSICPAGWHLPKAGTGSTTGNEFATLNGAMYNGGSASTTDNASTRANWRDSGPFSGTYAGYWTASFSYQGYYGSYWSSSAHSASNARYLNFYYRNVYPGSSAYPKYFGASVRCVM